MDPAKMQRWIPHSKWLPRDEVEYALQLSETEFLEMYGFEKPQRDQDVYLVSHDGIASEEAGWEFKKVYYHNVYNYRAGCNELFGEAYRDFPGGVAEQKLPPWKGPFPQHALYNDPWSKRQVLTRSGPFDREYEMQQFPLPDLEAETARHPSGPRSSLPYGLQ